MFVTSVTRKRPMPECQMRSIKALSDQQIADLQTGENGASRLPLNERLSGPSHVLELADKLELLAAATPPRAAPVRFHEAEAVPLGSRLSSKKTIWTSNSPPDRHGGKP